MPQDIVRRLAFPLYTDPVDATLKALGAAGQGRFFAVKVNCFSRRPCVALWVWSRAPQGCLSGVCSLAPP